MHTNREKTADFIKYLKKMTRLIEKEATLSIFSIKLVETKRLNDIFCCIEANWPNEYKEYIEKCGFLKLKSPKEYAKLKEATMNKFFLSANYCVVYPDKAIKAVSSLESAIQSDIEFISRLDNNQ